MSTTRSYLETSAESASADREQRIVLPGVTWAQYLLLNDELGRPGLRMAYCEGDLELMTTSRPHEAAKTMIARLVETWATELDVPLYGYGQTTFRSEAKARGAEPDECWNVGEDMQETPQIVLEVVISHGGLNKLRVYAGLEVPEVWFWLDGRFELYRLEPSGYEPIAKSRAFPELDFAELTRLVHVADQPSAIRQLRDRLRRR